MNILLFPLKTHPKRHVYTQEEEWKRNNIIWNKIILFHAKLSKAAKYSLMLSKNRLACIIWTFEAGGVVHWQGEHLVRIQNRKQNILFLHTYLSTITQYESRGKPNQSSSSFKYGFLVSSPFSLLFAHFVLFSTEHILEQNFYSLQKSGLLGGIFQHKVSLYSPRTHSVDQRRRTF